MNGPAVEQGASQMDAKASAALVLKHSEVIVGVKTAHVRGGAWESVDRAVEAGELSGTPVMVEFNPTPERSYADLLSRHMRPGDIQTQLYSRRNPLLGGDNKIADYVVAARNLGVLFDVGHGSDGFWFRSAIPAVQLGFLPDTISTDINKSSIMLPRANMTTTMSKFLNMGLSFEQVIERSTVRPAQAIRRPELGQLSEGGIADIAVFKVETGQFGFVDSGQSKMMGDRRIRCVLTIRNGRIVWDTEGLSLTDWQAAGRYSNYR
jgi:dihydroorotase